MTKEISLVLLVFLIFGSSGISSALAADFRTIDGSGNNIANPSWGQADEPLLRATPQAYDDALSPFSTPRGGFDPSSLPSARLISNAVSSQSGDMLDPSGLSDFLWLWGQFVDHDIDLTGGAPGPEPFNIKVPSGDIPFDPPPTPTGMQEISLSRSAFQDVAGVREQVNQITAYIDASNVYGSDITRSNALRTMDGTGKLLVSAGDLLPFNTGGLENANAGMTADEDLFLAGDVRANEQISLTAMHTLFVREHNRLADEIKWRLDVGDIAIIDAFTASGLSQGEFIFQSARYVVGAQIQQITYEEFLPILLGNNALPDYSIGMYDNTIEAQVDNEFSTAAYRVGHTMLSSFLQRVNEDGTVSMPLNLQTAFFNPSLLGTSSDLDDILRGMAVGQMQAVDTRLVDEVRNFLFGPPGSPGFDLASLNIQRGRDHGLPSYNDVRTMLMPPLGAKADFSAVTGGNMDLANALSTAYPDGISELDLWVGGLAEPPVNGGLVGETFFTLIAKQFQTLRDGDRFFYLKDAVASKLLMLSPDFQNTKLSDIILRNTDVESIQQNVFFAMDRMGLDTDGDGMPDAIDPDDDNDGIPDTIDTLPVTFSNSFADGAASYGHIISRGDQTVTILDETDPGGFLVSTSGGAEPATISSCGSGGTFSFDDGDSAEITCGSVMISVVGGSVGISFDMGTGLMTTTLAGGSMTFDPNPDFLSITTGPGTTVTVVIDGVETIIEENKTVVFEFSTNNSQEIGGEIIPIDSVSLILAGAQTNAVWIMSALAVIGSVAFGALYITSRKHENS